MTDEAKEIITDMTNEIGQLLGNLMVEAIEAEQARAEVEKDGNNWYESWQRKDKELQQAKERAKTLAEELAAVMDRNEKLAETNAEQEDRLNQYRAAVRKSEEGDHDNGGSN